MPFKLLVVVLGALGFVGLSGYEAYTDVLDPMDCINLAVGLAFLVGVALGREWARPMGMTLAGILLVQAVLNLLFMTSVGAGRGNMSRGFVTEFRIYTYTGKFVLGAALLWVMRHRDTIAWIVRREAHRDV
jgi:hypothetical protein